jgi:hypothetical protein
VSSKDPKTEPLTLDFQPSGFPDSQEAGVRLPRSGSVQSYGSFAFSPRQKGGGHSHSSSVDAPLLTHRAMEEDGIRTSTGKHLFTAPTVAPRKVMYFAAGSGIPEIKTLLSGFVIRGYLGMLATFGLMTPKLILLTFHQVFGLCKHDTMLPHKHF